MRKRVILALVVVTAAVASLLTVSVGWIGTYLGSQSYWELRGEDPILVEDQDRVHPVTGAGAAGIAGQLGYEPDTGCLVLDVDPKVDVWGPGEALLPSPVRAAVVWPKGTRPLIADDGRRGVAVGAFLGRIGGDPIFEGDRVEGKGWVAVASPDAHLLVGSCATDSGAIAVFTDPNELTATTADQRH